MAGGSENAKTKVIVTDTLLIRGHLLRCFNAVIQISNISMVSIENLPLPPCPAITKIFCALALSLVLFGNFSREDEIIGAGIFLLCFSLLLVAVWLSERRDAKKTQYLSVRLNSGDAYYLFYRDQKFVQQVLQLLANIIETGTTPQTNFHINMRECEIRENGSVIHLTEEAGL